MVTGRIHDGEFFPPSADGPRRSTLPSRGGSFICRCLHEAVLVVRSRHPPLRHHGNRYFQLDGPLYC